MDSYQTQRLHDAAKKLANAALIANPILWIGEKGIGYYPGCLVIPRYNGDKIKGYVFCIRDNGKITSYYGECEDESRKARKTILRWMRSRLFSRYYLKLLEQA